MGNTCGVLTDKLSLQKLYQIDKETPNPTGPSGKRKYSSALAIWKFTEKHGFCGSEFVAVDSLQSFSSRAAYGVVLVQRKGRERRAGSVASNNSAASPADKPSLNKLLSSAVEALSPRSLQVPWAAAASDDDDALAQGPLMSPAAAAAPRADNSNNGPKAADSGYAHYMYVWCGRRCAADVRSYAMAHMQRLVAAFARGDEAAERLHGSAGASLADIMTYDCDALDWDRAIHLLRKVRTSNGGAMTSGSLSTSPSLMALRDAHYGLFGRPDLAPRPRPLRPSLGRATGASTAAALTSTSAETQDRRSRKVVSRDDDKSSDSGSSSDDGSSRESSSDDDSTSSSDDDDAERGSESNRSVSPAAAESSGNDNDRRSREPMRASPRRVRAVTKGSGGLALEPIAPVASASTATAAGIDGDEFSGGLLSEFNPADDGGPEPDPNEEPPPDDAGHVQRIRFYDVRISEITPQIFLGSATGARKRKWLQRRGITHVVNCASMILKNWWPDDFNYLSLYILDGRREDVLCLVYDVLEWIDDAINKGGKVFVHCQQGVSRSTTVVVLYLMWKWKLKFNDTQSRVKACRNVASPNAGFIAQLVNWDRLLFGPVPKARLLFLAPQSTYEPDFIVPKLTTVKNPMTLMSNEVYILRSAERLWIWTGSSSPESHQKAAHRLAPLMIKFENAPRDVRTAEEGKEDPKFWQDLYGDSVPSVSPRTAAGPVTGLGSPGGRVPLKSPARSSGSGGVAVVGARSVAAAGMKLPLPPLNLSSAKSPPAGGAGGGAKSTEAKRPASPVKLKLNLGTIGVQKTLELSEQSAPVAVSPPRVEAATSESSNSSTSESDGGGSSSGDDDDDVDRKHNSSSSVNAAHSGSESTSMEEESQTTDDDEDSPAVPKGASTSRGGSAALKAVQNNKLRLGDISGIRPDLGPASPSGPGPLSPLSSPSLRHRLGLANSPKRAPVAMTLEQAKRSLESSLEPSATGALTSSSGAIPAVSSSTSSGSVSGNNSKRNSLSPESKRESRAPSPGSASGTPSANVSPVLVRSGSSGKLTVEMSPRAKRSRSIPPLSPSLRTVVTAHLGGLLPGLFVGDDHATEDAAMLTRLEIVDVVNLVGGSKFKLPSGTTIRSKTFFCESDDILSLMYTVISRIRETSGSSKGAVLLQDGPGTRELAIAFAIGYLMCEFRQPLTAAERAVSDRLSLGGVVLSDVCRSQLQLWEERLNGLFLSSGVRVYVVAKQSEKAPTLLVPRQLPPQPSLSRSILKPGEVLIIHSEHALYTWAGRQHKFTTLVAAKKIVAQMAEFEEIAHAVEHLGQGKETPAFWKLFSKD